MKVATDTRRYEGDKSRVKMERPRNDTRSRSASRIVSANQSNQSSGNDARSRKRGAALFSVILSGGPRSLLVMSAALGGIVLLAGMQSHFMISHVRSKRASVIQAASMRGVAVQRQKLNFNTPNDWEQLREEFLSQMRRQTTTVEDPVSNNENRGGKGDGICSMLDDKTTDMETLWNKFISSILLSSQHPDDPQFSHKLWTQQLLTELTPHLFAKTLTRFQHDNNKNDNNNKPLPDIAAAMERVLNVLQARLLHPDTAPPLQIAVLGGLVAEGEGCVDKRLSNGASTIPKGSMMGNPLYCAWPFRLEYFVNALFGGTEEGQGLIRVHNLAQSGTDTALVTPLVKNGIYSPSLISSSHGGPDVVINAYTMHDYPSNVDADGDGNGKNGGTAKMAQSSPSSSLPREKMQKEMEDFVEALLPVEQKLSHSCHVAHRPPLIVHLSDNDDLSESHPQILSIHYKDPVLKALKSDNVHQRDLHASDYGMAGHVTMSWIVSFCFAQVVLDHCSGSGKSSGGGALPPPPSHTTSLGDNAQTSSCDDNSSTSDLVPRCGFAFLAGPLGTVAKANEIASYIAPFTVENTGWKAISDMTTGWSRKAGLVAETPGARVVFSLQNTSKDIRSLHVLSLKSKSDLWRDGRARFLVTVDNSAAGGSSSPPNDESNGNKETFETSVEIDGNLVDSSLTGSVTHHVELDLGGKAVAGSNVKLSVELLEGSRFKILGLMLCT